MLASQKEATQAEGKPYYDNELVVCKANGAPQAANWISTGFGKLLESLEMPRIRFHDLRHPYVKPTTKNNLLQKDFGHVFIQSPFDYLLYKQTVQFKVVSVFLRYMSHRKF